MTIAPRQIDRNRSVWLAIAILILIPLFVFGQVATFELLDWDDDGHLWENPYFQPLTWQQLGRLWIEPYWGEYVPVLYTWFAAGIVLSGWIDGGSGVPPLEPAVFHVGNLLLHIACGLMVFRLLRRLVASTPAACLGALVFVLHPLVVEVVAWVSEARGLLSTLFGLLAIWHYLEFAARRKRISECLVTAKISGATAGRAPTGAPTADWSAIGRSSAASLRRSQPENDVLTRHDDRPASASIGSAAGWKRVGHYGLASVFFALALLAKPSAVAVPLVVAVLDWGYLRRGWRAMAASLALWIAMAGALAYFTKLEQGDELIRQWVPVWQRPLVAADALGFYLEKLVLPIGLAPDYGRMPSVVLDRGWLSWTWVLPVVLVALLTWLRSHAAWISAGVFVAGVLPVLGLVPFVFQDISTVADRYVYLALLGPALFCAAMLDKLSVRGPGTGSFFGRAASPSQSNADPKNVPVPLAYRVTQLAVVVLLLTWSVLDWRQLQHWRASETLFRYGLAQNERSMTMLNNMTATLRNTGRYEEALDFARRGVEAWPDRVKPYINLGVALQDVGDVDAAVSVLEHGIDVDPESLEARRTLAQALMRKQRIAAAAQQYEEMLRIDPQNALALLGLAKIAMEGGDWPTAQQMYAELAKSPPRGVDLQVTFADLAMNLGHTAVALETYQSALESFPDDVNLWVRTGMAHDRLGDLTAARDAFAQAIALGRQTPDVLHSLAAINHALEDYPATIENYRAILDQEPNDPTALNNLAWIFATHPSPSLRDAEQAVRLAQRLCQLFARPEALDTLAAAYAEAGDFDRAASTAREAAEMARTGGQSDLADEILARAARYDSARPFRETVPGAADGP